MRLFIEGRWQARTRTARDFRWRIRGELRVVKVEFADGDGSGETIREGTERIALGSIALHERGDSNFAKSAGGDTLGSAVTSSVKPNIGDIATKSTYVENPAVVSKEPVERPTRFATEVYAER